MVPTRPDPVVHLELHTGDLTRACAFYAGLFGWRTEAIETGSRTYTALGLGSGIDGGGVECATPRPLWLPYVEVPEIRDATDRARELGASVLLSPREGPAGWRSVVSAPAAGQVALWQAKR
jgi:predicted enzyme related to lactoylglutathione lyase